MMVALTEHIDRFLSLFAFTGGHSDLFLRLFQASIALAVFTFVIFIFRYQKIDAYIDNLRPLLRDLLNWTPDPHVLDARIQDIGKKDKHPPKQNDKDFFGKDNEVVQRFVADILELRKKKENKRSFRSNFDHFLGNSFIGLFNWLLLLEWLFLLCRCGKRSQNSRDIFLPKLGVYLFYTNICD